MKPIHTITPSGSQQSTTYNNGSLNNVVAFLHSEIKNTLPSNNVGISNEFTSVSAYSFSSKKASNTDYYNMHHCNDTNVANPHVWGTVKVELAFQALFLSLGLQMVKPQILVSQVKERFDVAGKLIIKATKKFNHTTAGGLKKIAFKLMMCF